LYLGSYVEDPLVNNEGGPLEQGSSYFNTVEESLKFYTGTQWVSPEGVATTKAQEASDSAAAALVSEQNAAASELVAVTKAGEASTSASNAATSEGNALDSENAAKDSELLAEKWASETTDVVVAGGKYSAKHWAEKSEDVRTSLHTLSVATGNYDTNVTYDGLTNTLTVPRGARGGSPLVEFTYNAATGNLEYGIVGYITTETQIINVEEW
jgi:hypothetical protein